MASLSRSSQPLTAIWEATVLFWAQPLSFGWLNKCEDGSSLEVNTGLGEKTCLSSGRVAWK